MTMRIQEDSLTPKYRQLKEILIRQIQDHGLKDGDPLPSESALMKEHQVSRNTIRLAVDLLVHEGIAVRQQGKGTFFTDSRPLKRPRYNVIALIAPLEGGSWNLRMILETEKFLSRKGYSLMIGNSSPGTEKERDLLERMAGKGIAGILFQPRIPPESLEGEPPNGFFRNGKVPCVLLGQEEPPPSLQPDRPIPTIGRKETLRAAELLLGMIESKDRRG